MTPISVQDAPRIDCPDRPATQDTEREARYDPLTVCAWFLAISISVAFWTLIGFVPWQQLWKSLSSSF
jgi:hypothetical protein